MKRIVATFMRLGSQRVPNKLLQPIGEQSLAEIMLAKLARLKARFPTELDVAMAVCPSDLALMDLAARFQCRVLERSALSRDGETIEDIYGELRGDLQQRGCQRLIVINPCQPFLSSATIVSFLADELATELPHSRAAVLRHRGWVWDQDQQKIHGDRMPNTKLSPEYFTLAHSMFSYPVHTLGTAAQMDFQHFFALDPRAELIDIDTEDDLRFARCYAAGLRALGSWPREM